MDPLSGEFGGPLAGLPSGPLSGYRIGRRDGQLAPVFASDMEDDTNKGRFGGLDGSWGQIQNWNPASIPDGAVGTGWTGDPYAERNPSDPIKLAGLRCEGFPSGCHSGGNFGANANYTVSGRNLCRECAVKMLGFENEPESEKIEVLRLYPLFGRK
jgi:hypothetical protein